MYTRVRKNPFRAFVWNQYFENRDEYNSVGEVQPHSFEVYWRQNISSLKAKYRLTNSPKDRIV